MNVTAIAVLVAFAAASPLAGAATVERQEIILSAENCQPALPAFDANIRKRPMAMQNEGTTAAFVTCAFRGLPGGEPSQKSISIGFVNLSSGAQSVTCTLVDGQAGLADPHFLPKTVVTAAGSTSFLTWTAVDNDGWLYIYPALSCHLPPSIGIRYTGRTYDEEIGS